MWPWEHLAFGYLLYSGWIHLRFRRSPDDEAVLVLAAATQLPDLIDKPLAWTFHLLPNGLSLAHSLLFAVPFLGIVTVLAGRDGGSTWATATAIGYLSHLAGDVLYGLATEGSIHAGFLLWPLVERPTRTPPGMISRVQDLFSSFLTFLQTPAGGWYLVGTVGGFAVVLALWTYDGRPGLGHVTRPFGGEGKRS